MYFGASLLGKPRHLGAGLYPSRHSWNVLPAVFVNFRRETSLRKIRGDPPVASTSSPRQRPHTHTQTPPTPPMALPPAAPTQLRAFLRAAPSSLPRQLGTEIASLLSASASLGRRLAALGELALREAHGGDVAAMLAAREEYWDAFALHSTGGEYYRARAQEDAAIAAANLKGRRVFRSASAPVALYNNARAELRRLWRIFTRCLQPPPPAAQPPRSSPRPLAAPAAARPLEAPRSALPQRARRQLASSLTGTSTTPSSSRRGSPPSCSIDAVLSTQHQGPAQLESALRATGVVAVAAATGVHPRVALSSPEYIEGLRQWIDPGGGLHVLYKYLDSYPRTKTQVGAYTHVVITAPTAFYLPPGLRLAASDYGVGVIFASSLPARTYLGQYVGMVLPHSSPTAGSPYVLGEERGSSPQFVGSPAAWASYMDCPSAAERGNVAASFSLGSFPTLHTTRAVRAGEWALMPYGKAWWARRDASLALALSVVEATADRARVAVHTDDHRANVSFALGVLGHDAPHFLRT